MNVFIISGSHMPEIAVFLRTLSRLADENHPAYCLLPTDVSSFFPDLAHQTYDPERCLPVSAFLDDATLFLLLSPYTALLDQFNRIASVLREARLEPVKCITCADVQAAETSQAYCQWLEASIYHSDLVLLGNRQGAGKAFIRNFRKGYEKACYPCRFLHLKGTGEPENPEEILFPDTRRLTRLFDLPEPEAEETREWIIESSFDLTEDPEEAAVPDVSELALSEEAPVPDISNWVVPRERDPFRDS